MPFRAPTDYEELTRSMEILPGRIGGNASRTWNERFERLAHKIAKPQRWKRYVKASDMIRVKPSKPIPPQPWWLALVHELEGAGRWKAGLSNGQAWNKVTTNVPKDFGPYDSWEAAATDIRESKDYLWRKGWPIGGAW